MERRAEDIARTVDAIRDAISQADVAGKIVFGPRSARAESDELRESSTLHFGAFLELGRRAIDRLST